VSILSQVFDEPKKIFSKSPEPAPIPPPRIPTIEAWLSETPDPFVDGETPPIATPTPSRIGFIETKVSREEVIHEDTNKIWDALGTNESGKLAVTERMAEGEGASAVQRCTRTIHSSRSSDRTTGG
jgi:hypothetical protein